jgi:hypothetical protein
MVQTGETTTCVFDAFTDSLLSQMPITYADTTDPVKLARRIWRVLPPYDGYVYSMMSQGIEFADAQRLAMKIASVPGPVQNSKYRTAAAVALRLIAMFGPQHGAGPTSGVFVGRTQHEETEVDLWYCADNNTIVAIGADGFSHTNSWWNESTSGYGAIGKERVRDCYRLRLA